MTEMLEIFNKAKIMPRSYKKKYTLRQYYQELDSYQRAARDSCPKDAPEEYRAKLNSAG
jgi:hypothetical protein